MATTPRKSQQEPTVKLSGWHAAARVFNNLADKFGVPGTFLLLIWLSVELWASTEQKQQIIDRYILGKGLSQFWPVIVVTLLALLAVWAYRERSEKRLHLIQDELNRCGAEKSLLQELLAERKLEHSQSRKRK